MSSINVNDVMGMATLYTHATKAHDVVRNDAERVKGGREETL